MSTLHAEYGRLTESSRFSWSNPRVRAIGWQVLAIGVVGALAVLIAVQTTANLRARGIVSGFDFLHRTTGFEVVKGPLPYSSRDNYTRALALGLANTLRVAMLGVIIAAILGLIIGVARLSHVWIISSLARGYIEVLRNTPLLLQLMFWYSLSQILPDPRNALSPFPGTFLSVRGLYLPRPTWQGSNFGLGAAVCVLVVFLIAAKFHRRRKGRIDLGAWTAMGALLIATLTVAHSWISFQRPTLMRYDFQGGWSISPEFAALLIGLSTYTAAFMAEIVRGGILAIDRGQIEAAGALGLSRFNILWRVVLPQALRIIIPPTTSQFLNLTKNSSLAVAIGYPDLISISNTTMNQTGQAIEAITIVMIFYLAISLSISLGMNLYNRAVLRRGGFHR